MNRAKRRENGHIWLESKQRRPSPALESTSDEIGGTIVGEIILLFSRTSPEVEFFNQSAPDGKMYPHHPVSQALSRGTLKDWSSLSLCISVSPQIPPTL
jgi:hypothetical protein